MRRALSICLLICLPHAAQEIPKATGMPDFPFSIKKTWFIGGAGNWDYITIDPAAQRLFIAHSSTVQVVDIVSGALVAEIPGFREAHSIALDDTGMYGYVSDGVAGAVMVFNRRSFAVEATVPIACSPRSVVFEPQSKLVFAICGASTVAPAVPPSSNQRPAGSAGASRPNGIAQQASISGVSHVVAIDTASRSVLADIAMAGDFRFAVADGEGQVYVSVGAVDLAYTDNGHAARRQFPPRIAKIDAQSVAIQARSHQSTQSPAPAQNVPFHIDWSPDAPLGSLIGFLPLAADCTTPQGLAIDSRHQRLFAACDSQRFVVLDTSHGDLIASMTTGPSDEVIGYDRDRGLIFIANGGGYGSLTFVRQDATTDSYEVIQNLPTKERARTLAVDSTTGDVYLVTDFHGVDLAQTGGIGSLKAIPLSGSFQVLVVGH